MQLRFIMVRDPQTNKLTGAITIQCLADSLARSVINNIDIANFNPGIGTPQSRDFGIGKQAGIPGFRDPGINSLITSKQSNLRHLPYMGWLVNNIRYYYYYYY